jgi:hypothetical protein
LLIKTLSKGTGAFTISLEMKPTGPETYDAAGKRMFVIITADCPLIPSERLNALTRFHSSSSAIVE